VSTAGRDGGRRGIPRVTAGGAPGIGTLADVADLFGGESERSRRLLGGLMAGALVGAALAGYVLRSRQGGGRPRSR
jgi:hypothetical protein